MSIDSQSFQHGHLKDFREEMNKIKSPFMERIRNSTQMFQTKIKQFQQNLNNPLEQDIKETVTQNPIPQKYRQTQLDTEQTPQQKQNHQPLLTIKQKAAQRLHTKNKPSQLPLNLMKQWLGNKQFAFTNVQQVKQNFTNVFSKKLSVKKEKPKCYDFKEDERVMLVNIFREIQNAYGPNKGLASIDKIVQFFEENQLFYLFYNLHPNRLKYVLKEYARTKPDSLTEKEFLYVFFMDRPLLKDLSDPYEKVVHRKCILDTESWAQLKKIFNTLDTFGNETIHIRPFFNKLKTCHSNPNLIYTPVIQFPQIQRVYTLKKIVFDLEHKFSFKQKVQWKDIEQTILNFNHKEEPTLDAIFQKHLEKATILLDSNYFLIDKKVVNVLKGIFQKCPKFSQFFVNTKFACNQILECPELRQFMKNPIREKTHIYGGYINLEEATRSMSAKAPQYIDLDQFLQYFSIKGPITNVLLEIPDQLSSSEQEEQIQQQRKKMLRKIRSMQKLDKTRKNKKTKRPVRQVTDFQEFNLSKKQKQTIRQKKLKQMLKEKQQQEQNQLKKKFKANPIPADLNPQRLRQQQKRMQMRKRKKLQQVAKQRQQDKQILNYLKANTKLFQPINKQPLQQTDPSNFKKQTLVGNKFTHKPVPWFVQEHLLEKIEREKSERKKKIYEEARLKYVRSWNKLPDFFFHDEENENSAENSIIQELRKKNYEREQVRIKANPVPDFQSLHKEFQRELESKKKQFQPTKVQQFNLTSPKIVKGQAHSEYMSPQHEVRRFDKSSWQRCQSPPPKITSTKKTSQWMEHNKKLMEQKRAAQQQQRQKEKQRVTKQKNFAKFMSKKLKIQEQSMPDLQAQTAQKLKRHKKTVHHLQKVTEKELCQMYARVLQRPFLFELASSNTVHVKGKKKSKNLKKKGVIKNIEPIDVTESSHNNYNHNGPNNIVDHFEEGEQYSEAETEQRHEALNQSF